jgi:signal transduction histidine kinase
LQIDFSALSLSSSPKLRFRHWLVGVDSGWVYDGEGRQAYYSGLSPGDYRFRVSATVGGTWTEPTVWAFTVAPPFFLSWWFLTSIAATVVGIGAVGTWARVRALKTRFALVAAERARMSREIHDTLLQSLAALGPELEALAVRASPADGTIAEELRRVRRDVRRSVREARDSILELRRQANGATRLDESLEHLAGMMEARHGLRPRITVSGERPTHGIVDVEQQMYQIAKEAVINALRHGSPTSVDIAVAYTGRELSVTVRDDGCGFRPDARPASHRDDTHFGLETMRERAEKIGGSLTIDSTRGEGTTVHAVARVTRWQ